MMIFTITSKTYSFFPSQDCLFTGKLLRILSVIAENLAYTERSRETHLKREKVKSGSALQNAESLVSIFRAILKELSFSDHKQASDMVFV